MAVLCSTFTVPAQEYTNIVQSFEDSSLSGVGSIGGSGTVTPYTILDWKATDGNPDGCLWVQIPWIATGGGWQEIQINYDFPWPGVTLAPYATIEYDVKVVGSPNAGTDGRYGNVQLVLQGWNDVGANGNPSGMNWATLGLTPITQAGTWQHVTHRITAFEKYNMNRAVINFVGQNCTETMEYLVDNLVITVPTSPPPAITLSKVPPGGGLHLLTAGGGNDRQNIRTVGANYSFYNAGGPVTYSFTVSDHPSVASYPGYQTHLMLTVGATTTYPDWSAPHVIMLDLENGAAILRVKTNAANSNGLLYVPVAEEGGSYPPVPSTTMLGTWSLTFNNNTSVTVTTPDGTSSNYVFTAAEPFNSSDFRVYFGAQAIDVANIGQEVVLSKVEIKGVAGGLSDNFNSGVLDTTKWQVSAAQPGNVYVLAPNTAYRVSWPLPDNLFKLTSSPDLRNMTNSSLASVVSATTRTVYVPEGYPSAEKGFFGLAKRAYQKLQVLMPGETAAPGTPSGKTGTPITQKAGVPFQVQINAVDEKWNQAFANTPVWMESQPAGDGSGFRWADQLVHGSYSYTFTNTTPGTFKIHAGDNVDSSKFGDGSDYTVE